MQAHMGVGDTGAVTGMVGQSVRQLLCECAPSRLGRAEQVVVSGTWRRGHHLVQHGNTAWHRFHVRLDPGVGADQDSTPLQLPLGLLGSGIARMCCNFKRIYYAVNPERRPRTWNSSLPQCNGFFLYQERERERTRVTSCPERAIRAHALPPEVTEGYHFKCQIARSRMCTPGLKVSEMPTTQRGAGKRDSMVIMTGS